MNSLYITKGNYLSAILRSNKTVFTTEDIALLWHESLSPKTLVRINYYVKQGELIPLRRGIYAKNENYNKLELATRIITPAYVSFETILAREGVIFQFYMPIFVASYTTRQLLVDKQVYTYRKIKQEILLNPLGVEHTNDTSSAVLERALLDTLYVGALSYFDNLRSINWELLFSILPIYTNRQLEKKVEKLNKDSQTSP